MTQRDPDRDRERDIGPDPGPAWAWTLINLFGLLALILLSIGPRMGGFA